jgi:hypothetical protein
MLIAEFDQRFGCQQLPQRRRPIAAGDALSEERLDRRRDVLRPHHATEPWANRFAQHCPTEQAFGLFRQIETGSGALKVRSCFDFSRINLERAKGFEPSTPTLARSCSTPELHPRPKSGRSNGCAEHRAAMPKGEKLCNHPAWPFHPRHHAPLVASAPAVHEARRTEAVSVARPHVITATIHSRALIP